MPYGAQVLRNVVGGVYVHTWKRGLLLAFGVLPLSLGQGIHVLADETVCPASCEGFLLMDSTSASTRILSTFQPRATFHSEAVPFFYFPKLPRSLASPHTPHIALQGVAFQLTTPLYLILGRPSYPFGQQSSSKKLFIFGYRKSIPSSRKLVSISGIEYPNFLRETSGKVILTSRHTLTGAQPQRPLALVLC